jgi:hypothetical protein
MFRNNGNAISKGDASISPITLLAHAQIFNIKMLSHLSSFFLRYIYLAALRLLCSTRNAAEPKVGE